MRDQRLPADEFDRVAGQQCGRWESRSLEAARAVLVDGQRPAEVASRLGMSPQHVYVLRKRFLGFVAVKVPAKVYMEAVPPDWAVVLSRFEAHVRSLMKSGYSPTQIADYLRANDVEVPPQDL